MSIDHEELLERYLAISRAIAGQLDFQSVLRQIGGEIHALFQHDHLDISIILPDQPECCVAFEVGMKTEWSNKAKEPGKIAHSPIRDLLSGRTDHIITGDAWADKRFHFESAFDAPIYGANLRSRIHVPLHIHGDILGSLNISRHELHKYDDEDLQIAQQIADLVSPYFYALNQSEEAQRMARAEGGARGRAEALRLGTLRLTEGMENERKNIGMDLHDQTLADLTRISHQVSQMARKKKTTVADIAKLEAGISTCISELRRIIEDAKPGVMELFGFAQAVEAQLERSVDGIVPKIATRVIDGASSLLDDCPDSLRTTLFRIVQEAINNAVKHGRPGNLAVTIQSDEKYIHVTVVDDGTGTNKEHERSARGLDNMRVRAALISANLSICGNEPLGGTRVSIAIPRSTTPHDTHHSHIEAISRRSHEPVDH